MMQVNGHRPIEAEGFMQPVAMVAQLVHPLEHHR